MSEDKDPRKGWNERGGEKFARIDASADSWTTFPIVAGLRGHISSALLRELIGDPFADNEDES